MSICNRGRLRRYSKVGGTTKKGFLKKENLRFNGTHARDWEGATHFLGSRYKCDKKIHHWIMRKGSRVQAYGWGATSLAAKGIGETLLDQKNWRRKVRTK